MLIGFFNFLFTLNCFFLILLILVQKGKSGMGLGSIGGGTQMLFGGSGGQDLFQKITWGLGVVFMAGSLILAIAKTKYTTDPRYVSSTSGVPFNQEPL